MLNARLLWEFSTLRKQVSVQWLKKTRRNLWVWFLWVLFANCLLQWSIWMTHDSYWADPCITEANTACSLRNIYIYTVYMLYIFCLQLLGWWVCSLWNPTHLKCFSWKQLFFFRFLLQYTFTAEWNVLLLRVLILHSCLDILILNYHQFRLDFK